MSLGYAETHLPFHCFPAADANRASSQGNVTAPKINSAAQRRVLSPVSCWNVSAKTESHRIKIQLPTSNKEGVSVKGARRLLLFVEFWRRGVRKGEEFGFFLFVFSSLSSLLPLLFRFAEPLAWLSA